MANPTAQVPSTYWDFVDSQFYWPMDPTANTTFYTGEMVGKAASGYLAHYDDSAPLEFLGTVFQQHDQILGTDNITKYLRVGRPRAITIPLASGTLSRTDSNGTTGAGAIGKMAYAVDSGHVTLDPSALIFANPVGEVFDIGDPSTVTSLNSTVSACILPAFAKAGGELVLPATGNTTLGVSALNKMIYVPNTANVTITLPPIVTTSPGIDKIQFMKTVSANNSIITLDGLGSETINGSATNVEMDAQYDTLTVQSNGNATGWLIAAKIIS